MEKPLSNWTKEGSQLYQLAFAAQSTTQKYSDLKQEGIYSGFYGVAIWDGITGLFSQSRLRFLMCPQLADGQRSHIQYVGGCFLAVTELCLLPSVGYQGLFHTGMVRGLLGVAKRGNALMPWLAPYLLMSHWSKKVMWPSPVSKSKETDSTS